LEGARSTLRVLRGEKQAIKTPYNNGIEDKKEMPGKGTKMIAMDSRVISTAEKIQRDFSQLDEGRIDSFFEQFMHDNRTLSFLKFYNKTVLDGERINFGEFKRQWAIQGMSAEVYRYFDENYEKLREEILNKKDIRSFFIEHCTKKRKEAAFCSKLFHTFLPEEFPPIDNPIKSEFSLIGEDPIESILVIKKGYDLFVRKNPDKMKLIRQVLSKPKFSFLRIQELSDIRILDMFYWFKLSRSKRKTFGTGATPLDPKQVVTSEELLLSQMVQQEALTRLLIMKGLFTKEEFLHMVKAVDQEMKRQEKRRS
jgi:hypothetical protein